MAIIKLGIDGINPPPLDIFAIIFDILKEDEDFETLKSCALVQRDFVYLCQRHIYAKIDINSKNTADVRALYDVLLVNPGLILHIREVELHIYTIRFGLGADALLQNDLILPVTLKRLTNVRSFTLRGLNAAMEWPNLTDVLCSTLWNLIQSPNIVRLAFHHIKQIPLYDLLLGATHLQHLTLGSKLEDHLVEASAEGSQIEAKVPQLLSLSLSGAATLKRLQSVKGSGSRPLLDLSMISSLKTYLRLNSDFEIIMGFLGNLSHIKFLDLSVQQDPVEVYLKLFRLIKPSLMRALRVLKLSARVSKNQDPLRGLCEALLLISADNVMERVSISIANFSGGPNIANAGEVLLDYWTALDEFFADTAKFPWLVTVDILISVDNDAWDEESDLMYDLVVKGKKNSRICDEDLGRNLYLKLPAANITLRGLAPVPTSNSVCQTIGVAPCPRLNDDAIPFHAGRL